MRISCRESPITRKPHLIHGIQEPQKWFRKNLAHVLEHSHIFHLLLLQDRVEGSWLFYHYYKRLIYQN